MIIQYPLTTEKVIKMIEAENKMAFIVDRRSSKQEIKKTVEKEFNVKVESVNTEIKQNKKIAFVKLKKEFKAMDIATKLGLM
jgi:large subunit ribosomal protein L23